MLTLKGNSYHDSDKDFLVQQLNYLIQHISDTSCPHPEAIYCPTCPYRHACGDLVALRDYVAGLD